MYTRIIWTLIAAIALPSLLAGCVALPKDLSPVSEFDADRYMGTWYEIARLDHRFERGLSEITAEYTQLDNGKVEVINRGYNVQKESWDEAVGMARFNGEPTVASLRVSFVPFIWGGYHVVILDDDYQYAVVAGPSRNYLWILAREPELDPETLKTLVAQAKEWGFDTEALIYPEHGVHGRTN